MPANTDFQPRIARQGDISTSIAAGKTESAIFNNKGMSVIAIETPSNFTTATLTFKKVPINGNNANATKTVNDLSQEVFSISAEPDGYYPVPAGIFGGIDQFKVIADTAQTEEVDIAFVQIPFLYS